MAVSWPCRLSVAAYAAAGPDVAVPRPSCPNCARPMGFEGSYPRLVREAGLQRRIRIRRAACQPCGVSHALLPDFIAHRRRDSVEAIGAALARPPTDHQARAEGLWHGVPARTVRSWRQRFRERAELLTSGLVALTVAWDELPDLPLGQGPATMAVAAVGAAWWAASRRWPGRVPGAWRLANVVVGSHLLSTRTHLPWAGQSGVPQPVRGP